MMPKPPAFWLVPDTVKVLPVRPEKFAPLARRREALAARAISPLSDVLVFRVRELPPVTDMADPAPTVRVLLTVRLFVSENAVEPETVRL